MSMLRATVTSSGGRVTVALAGTLDISTMDQALHELGEASGSASALVIDLRGLDFVDSSGLSVIARTAMQAGEAGVTATVIPSQTLRRLMEITGIASHINLEASDG
jgi:anti-sigma B factor antagonist